VILYSQDVDLRMGNETYAHNFSIKTFEVVINVRKQLSLLLIAVLICKYNVLSMRNKISLVDCFANYDNGI
jgi:hypothetical protein